MFEHLPIVNEGAFQAFVDTELITLVKNLNAFLERLREENYYLSRVIEAQAETVAEDFEGETKEFVKSDALTAQLTVLRLIDRGLHSEQLEAELSRKPTLKK